MQTFLSELEFWHKFTRVIQMIEVFDWSLPLCVIVSTIDRVTRNINLCQNSKPEWNVENVKIIGQNNKSINQSILNRISCDSQNVKVSAMKQSERETDVRFCLFLKFNETITMRAIDLTSPHLTYYIDVVCCCVRRQLWQFTFVAIFPVFLRARERENVSTRLNRNIHLIIIINININLPKSE